MDKCAHESSIVISDCTGFFLLRCTWGCGQDLIQLDLGNHEVKTYTAAELIEMTDGYKTLIQHHKEHHTELQAVEANYDALMSPMPCSHLGRYQFEEEGTQYCSLCGHDDLIETIDIIGQVLQHINFRDAKQEVRHEQ